MPTPFVLGALALILAGPVPRLLAAWHGLRRTPYAALALWQSVALAAVLSAVGAGLSVVTLHSVRSQPGTWSTLVGVVAGLLTLVVVARLAVSGHHTGTNLRRLRRRHREQLDLVARADRSLRIVDHPVPVAYCVPGMSRSRIVVSESTVAALDESALAAVLAHERSHLRWRHDLVLEAFSVLHRAFPRFVSSAQARREVELLVEVLADRAAIRAVGRGALGRALLALVPPAGSTGVPGGALGAAPTGLGVRVGLLSDTSSHRVQAGLVWLTALGLLVLPTALVVAPWLIGLRSG